MRENEKMVMLATLDLLTITAMIIMAVMLSNTKERVYQLEHSTDIVELKSEISSLTDAMEKADEEINDRISSVLRITRQNTKDILDIQTKQEKELKELKDKLKEIIEKLNQIQFLGTYELTAYEYTGNACANGNMPTLNYTVACNSIPLGTKLYIKGMGVYVNEDRGGMAGNVIDIYMGDPYICKLFGRREADVYVIK